MGTHDKEVHSALEGAGSDRITGPGAEQPNHHDPYIGLGRNLQGSRGHAGVQALSLTTLEGLVTITLSTYMILYAQPLNQR